ncbi:hypothetical protein ACIOML_29130 [Streptomyces anulatus]
MSDFEKAAKDAVDAAANSEQLALIAAVLQAQQLTQQPPAPAPAAPPSSGNTVKWLAIGGGIAVGAPFFLIAFALSAMAVAISAVAVTICVLVLRSVWQEIQKPK